MEAFHTLSRRLLASNTRRIQTRTISVNGRHRNATVSRHSTARLTVHSSFRTNNQLIIRSTRRLYSQGTKPQTPNPTPQLGSPESHSLSARLKKLTREYGYTVIGVYLALSVADFPFCFLAVKLLGAERVANAEHLVVGGAKRIIQKYFPTLFKESTKDEAGTKAVKAAHDTDGTNDARATLWTQLALAFVIHKSFIFVRVPLTAAVTPKVVKTLRGWGYDIGKRRNKVAKTPKTA